MPWRPRMRAPVGKSGPSRTHQVVRGGVGVLEEVGGGVDDLAQIVGGCWCHAHGDPWEPLTRMWEPGGQHGRSRRWRRSSA